MIIGMRTDKSIFDGAFTMLYVTFSLTLFFNDASIKNSKQAYLHYANIKEKRTMEKCRDVHIIVTSFGWKMLERK